MPDGYHWPIHYDRPTAQPAATQAKQAALPSVPHVHLQFHGGPVQTTTTTFAIYWVPMGSFIRSGYRRIIDQYLIDVGGTPLYGYATEYRGSDGAVKNQSKFAGSWVDTTPFPPGGLTDDIADRPTQANDRLEWGPRIPSESSEPPRVT